MFGIVLFTKISSLFGVGLLLGFSITRVLVLRLRLLLPADFVEALSEQNNVRKHGLSVEVLVHLLGNIVEVKSEYLVYFHGGAVIVREVLIIALFVILGSVGLWVAFVFLEMEKVLEQRILVKLAFV